MRILILGAGAIGGYFGGRLAAAGVDVTFLVRAPRAEVLRRNGLVITSPVGDVRVDAKTVTQAPHPFDVVVLTNKAYDLSEAIEAVAPAVGDETLVLPLLNGVRHLDILDERFGATRVLGGLCHIGATLGASGEVIHLAPSAIFMLGARFSVQGERCAALHTVLMRGGFAPTLSDAIMQDMWEKLVFITAYSGITSLMRAPIGAIVAASDGERLSLALLDECAAIGAAAGFAPREAFLARSRRTMSEKGSPATSSMLRDIVKGARIEHDHIQGDMLGRAGSLETPVLRVVMAHLQAYEALRTKAERAL